MIKNIDFSQLWDIPLKQKELGLQNYDNIKLIEFDWFSINVTIFNSWIVIALITLCSWLATRNLKNTREISRFQTLIEALVLWLKKESSEISGSKTNQYLGMAMGLFCFIFVCNLLTFFPWFRTPTASMSTTMALAMVVFIAVPYFSIKNAGLKNYLKNKIAI